MSGEAAGPSAPSAPVAPRAPEPFEHYVTSGGRRLRCGFTTGTCAALAARGAAERLCAGAWPATVRLVTPRGLPVEVALEGERVDADGRGAACAVRKDAGDDADVTAGALVEAHVRLVDEPGVAVEGGSGVGRVTRPGLDQPVGTAAINRVPRRMIEQAVAEVLEACGCAAGVRVTVSVPGGEALAAKTFNPNLGVVGGISILGTSGVVEPMSMQALADTVAVEIRQAAALAREAHGVTGAGDVSGRGARLVLVPGNYGADFLSECGLVPAGTPVVKCSNFIGEALDEAAACGFSDILLVGHAGKLVKLAGGVMNTHNRYADCRCELVCAHAAVCGAGADVCRALMACATTDACVEVLDAAGLREPVMESLLAAIQRHLDDRAAKAPPAPAPAVRGGFGAHGADGVGPGPACGAHPPRVGAAVFSNVYGELGRTRGACAMLAEWGR